MFLISGSAMDSFVRPGMVSPFPDSAMSAAREYIFLFQADAV